ncbi:hypothetical protein [Nonomuraea sp. GTA35]|uniref:hypothetical protein n=1 Tax=Nonomuraea sp. GTA35 TaxID=1676746 RepID=UPI0035C0E608
MTDLAQHYRDLKADVDQRAAELGDIRTRLDAAAQAYQARRRYSPAGVETCAAHTAWALALREWVTALTAHAAATDRLRAERRNVGQDVAGALQLPTRPAAGGPR